MKIGLIAYSTSTGLGYQTEEFFMNMEPFKTLLCDISQYNLIETHHDRFPGARICKGFPTERHMQWLTDGIDILFVAETPLNYRLFELAKEKGVKIVQQPNYEFFDYFNKPELPKPDLLGLPTLWNRDKFVGFNYCHLPVPVNRNKFQRRRIKKVKTFIHIVGRPTYEDRNGTIEFLEAVKQFGGEYKFVIYYQTPTDKKAIENFAPVWEKMIYAKLHHDVEFFADIPDNRWLYVLGDVLVLPRKYGGLCLPVQEALSCGLPVIMTDVEPNYYLLPKEWLCDAELVGNFKFHAPVDVFQANVDSLVDKMKKMADVEFYEEARYKAENIARALDWKVLKDYYFSVFNDVASSNTLN